jgi:hypothetical protein
MAVQSDPHPPVTADEHAALQTLGVPAAMMDARLVGTTDDLRVGDELTMRPWDSWQARAWTVTSVDDTSVTVENELDTTITAFAPGHTPTRNPHSRFPTTAWYNDDNGRWQYLALRDDTRELSADHGTVLDRWNEQLGRARERLSGGEGKRLQVGSRQHIVYGTTPVDGVPNGVTTHRGGTTPLAKLAWLRERTARDETFIPREDTQTYHRGDRHGRTLRYYHETLPENAIVGELSDDEALAAIHEHVSTDIDPIRLGETRRYESGAVRVSYLTGDADALDDGDGFGAWVTASSDDRIESHTLDTFYR